MGGKRPDQYRIDHAEAGATDYKSLDEDEQLHNADKQRLVEAEQREKSYIPESNENPVQAELRSRKGKEGRAGKAGVKGKAGGRRRTRGNRG